MLIDLADQPRIEGPAVIVEPVDDAFGTISAALDLGGAILRFNAFRPELLAALLLRSDHFRR